MSELLSGWVFYFFSSTFSRKTQSEITHLQSIPPQTSHLEKKERKEDEKAIRDIILSHFNED